MRRVTPFLLVLIALGPVAGCGDSDDASDATVTSKRAAAGRTATAAAPATTTESATTTADPAPTAADKGKGKGTGKGTGKDSPFVVVTSLLGKQLPQEPQCRFAKTFEPDNPARGSYDGALALTVTCAKTGGYTPTGQIVNRAGSKPTEITCRDTTGGQLYCIYVPSTSVGLYFTGTDRAVVRRRLEHLIEVVASLPTGVTPLPGPSTP